MGSVTPTRPVRPWMSPRALRFGLKLCSFTTRSTVSRVSGETSPRPFTTRETVAIETPANSAISRIVTRAFRGRPASTGGATSTLNH